MAFPGGSFPNTQGRVISSLPCLWDIIILLLKLPFNEDPVVFTSTRGQDKRPLSAPWLTWKQRRIQLVAQDLMKPFTGTGLSLHKRRGLRGLGTALCGHATYWIQGGSGGEKGRQLGKHFCPPHRGLSSGHSVSQPWVCLLSVETCGASGASWPGHSCRGRTGERGGWQLGVSARTILGCNRGQAHSSSPH